jgi:hypothetical protein
LSEATGLRSRGLRTVRIAVILAGTIAFVTGLRTFGKSYSMTRWPVTPARILSSEVTSRDDARFTARVEYEFLLAGRVHRGTMTERAPTRAAAESLVALYPSGSEIAVGFDPGEPGASVLRPRINWWNLALTIAGAGLLAAGVWPRKA